MHSFLMSSGPVDVLVLSTGVHVADLAYAHDITLIASSPQGLQRLIDIACHFCAPMGMTVSVAETEVMVINIALLGHFSALVGVSSWGL